MKQIEKLVKKYEKEVDKSHCEEYEDYCNGERDTLSRVLNKY
jgi:hypothetical protein